MATQIILSKLTNLVIPDEIIFDIDKMVYHAKHAVHHGKVMDELIFLVKRVCSMDPALPLEYNHTRSFNSLGSYILSGLYNYIVTESDEVAVVDYFY